MNANATCTGAGVTAALARRSTPAEGESEDSSPAPLGLVLKGPALVGVQLLTAVSRVSNAEIAVQAFGSRVRDLRVVPRLTLTGTARSGTITVTETTSVGSCAFTVTSVAGDTAAIVAQKIQDAFLARPAQQTFQPKPACLDPQNGRDVHRSGSVLQYADAYGLIVSNTDAGLSFTIDSEP